MWLGVDYFDNDALDAVDDKAVDLNPGDAHHEESGESSPSEGEQESHKDCQHLPESEQKIVMLWITSSFVMCMAMVLPASLLGATPSSFAPKDLNDH